MVGLQSAGQLAQRGGEQLGLIELAAKVAALLPGDLVIFAGTYGSGISHVGIYVGDGRMIHASTPGRGVCYDALDEAYWVAHYYGARRPW